MDKIKAIKGTFDILHGEVSIWQKIESIVREMMELYAYDEVRTPIFEETGLFARSIGEDTDIVGKEMYTFRDMGNRSITLRPEGTASVVRSFIEHSLEQKGLPQKLWYMGPMFRQERPQKGRYRQFHQFGVEVIGSSSPMVDAEVMMLFDRIVEKFGLEDRVFSINMLGGTESREAYRNALVSFLDTVEDKLCDDCKRRKKTNPLRVLDCKITGCREVVHDEEKLPRTVDCLTDEDRKYFDMVQEMLNNKSIRFTVDYFLVRGLDYYTGTVFEMNYRGLGAQSAIAGGGRYDNLLKELGGPDLPAVGFACGIERLILAMQTVTRDKSTGSVNFEKKPLKVYIVTTDFDTIFRGFDYLETIRQLGYSADMDYLERSVKAQMKSASRSNAKYALFIEPEDNTVTARNMILSEQQKMSFDEFLSLLEKTTIEE